MTQNMLHQHNSRRRAGRQTLAGCLIMLALIAGGSTLAHAAEDGSGQESGTTENTRSNREERNARRETVRAWIQARKAAHEAREIAVREARSEMVAVLRGVRDLEARAAAKTAFREQVAAAQAAYKAAIEAIGPRPSIK